MRVSCPAESGKLVGYTEASRGCKHLCRHCPIVPVYEGRFRVVQRDVVLADVRQQIAGGSGTHNVRRSGFSSTGPGHALAIVEAFHAEFPDVTYDVTIKIEHLLKHRDALPVLKRTGCLFITSAVESLDDRGARAAGQGAHARRFRGSAGADASAWSDDGADVCRVHAVDVTREDYLDLLRTIRDLDLVEHVAPIQLAIRLLIPAGSKLLELDDLRVEPFDPAALSYRWRHPDPEMDRLCADLQKLVRAGDKRGASRAEIFGEIWQRAFGELPDFHLADRATIPYLTEPWYC